MAKANKFEFEGKPAGTYGELGARVWEIAQSEDRSRAKRFMAAYEDFMRAHPVPNVEAKEVVARNIGYLSGYYCHADAKLIRRIFEVEHPILGARSDEDLSPQELFDAGVEWAKRAGL